MEQATQFGKGVLKSIERYTKTDMIYLTKSGFWLTAGSIAGSLLSLILSIFLAQLVSKDEYGIYKYIISMSGIAVAFSLTGMNTAITRAVARGNDGIFKASLWVQLRWSLPQFLFGVALAGYYYLQDNTTYTLAFSILAIFAPLSTVFNSYNSYLSGKKDFRTSTIYGFVSNIIYFSAMMFAVFTGASAFSLVASYFIANTFSNILFTWLSFKKYKPVGDHDPADITYGKHLSVMNLLGIIAVQIDNVLVYHLLGPTQLAIYNFALLLPDRIRSILGNITSIALPKLSALEPEAARAAVLRKIPLLIGGILVTIVAYVIAAPTIFSLLFPQYMDSVVYSQVASLTILALIATFFVTGLVAERSTKSLYKLSVLSPLSRIALVAILVYLFGLWGAITARIVTAIAQLIFVRFFAASVE